MRARVVALAWFVGGATLTTACAPGDKYQPPAVAEASVPVADILAAPRAFNGKLVTIRGYFNLEYEGTAVFPSREDAAQHRSSRGIWLRVEWPLSSEVSRLGNRHVRVRGTFEHLPNGSFPGRLRNVTGMWPADGDGASEAGPASAPHASSGTTTR